MLVLVVGVVSPTGTIAVVGVIVILVVLHIKKQSKSHKSDKHPHHAADAFSYAETNLGPPSTPHTDLENNPVPPSPMVTDLAKTIPGNSSDVQRTFANSNYKRFYDKAKPAPFQHRLLAAVNDMLELYAARINSTLNPKKIEEGVHAFMKRIQDDAFKHDKTLQNDVAAAAEFLWTSAKVHMLFRCMELCSIINAVIRDDIAKEIQVAVTICRSINMRRVTRATADGVDPSYPPNGETWRGGGFRQAFAPFFESLQGQKYRVPSPLAPEP